MSLQSRWFVATNISCISLEKWRSFLYSRKYVPLEVYRVRSTLNVTDTVLSLTAATQAAHTFPSPEATDGTPRRLSSWLISKGGDSSGGSKTRAIFSHAAADWFQLSLLTAESIVWLCVRLDGFERKLMPT
jgi:hypothetical protein